ncbi:hypothetical protein [Streptomyces sp. NPDC047990]|uniref:hypothetical protein n=1 Tax=Streptomyces sp. NPDC047990 TaxID=3365496 RepID=UPI00371DD89C
MQMTREEYEERQRALEEETREARDDYINAKSRYDRLCEQQRNLRIEWNEQQKEDRA